MINKNNIYIRIIIKLIWIQNYLIKDRIMYFNCDFNESLDNYTDITKNYSQIIFSNYDNNNYELCISTKKQFKLQNISIFTFCKLFNIIIFSKKFLNKL